jgi:ribulose-phosphate 3-epimerase
VSVVVPTVLAENTDDFKEMVERVQPFAQRIHLDLADGEFAPTTTVSSTDIWWPKEMQADIHAMVAHPEKHVQALVAQKPHLIIFHAELQINMPALLQYVKQFGIKAGVALQRSTVPATVKAALEAADHCMIFSGDLGHYGGTASLMQLEKVRLIKAINAGLEIGWDGGVTVENAYSLAQNGVDVLNVGGAIQKAEDPQKAYAALVNEINKHGVM